MQSLIIMGNLPKGHVEVQHECVVYNCSQCNKYFTHLKYLNKHKRNHNKERPYQCSQCNKAFTHKYYLKKHMVIHCEEMSFFAVSAYFGMFFP